MTILSRAGQYLQEYERARYTFREHFAWMFGLFGKQQSIVLPADPEHLADVSFYQAGMDWDIYALHARAAIIRIGQNTWPDTSFATFYNEAKAHGIALGGYWFFDGRASPDQQLAVIKQQMSGRSFEMELYVDWERNYGGAYEGLPRVVELMQKIEAAGIKCKGVGIYTGYYWFTGNSNATVNAAQYTYLKQRPLWLAWYASASVVKIPQPWNEWTLWQYGTPSLKWGQPTMEIDANYSVFNRSQFEQIYLGGVVTPPNGGNMYELTPAGSYTVSIRAPHVSSHIQGGKIGQINNGSSGKAVEKYVYPSDVYVSGVLRARAGDTWWKVHEANGLPVDGWAAEIHLGARYLNVRQIGEPTGSDEIEIYVNGEMKYHVVGKMQ